MAKMKPRNPPTNRHQIQGLLREARFYGDKQDIEYWEAELKKFDENEKKERNGRRNA